MSLAMLAASYNNDTYDTYNTDKNDNVINQKRVAHKKTQKIYPKLENFDTNKVNSVLQKIHNSSQSEDEEDDDNYNNTYNYNQQKLKQKDSTEYFSNPPPKSQSIGVEKSKTKKYTENLTNMDNNISYAPHPNDNDEYDLNDYSNYGNDKTNEEYYKKMLPDYLNNTTKIGKNTANRPYYKYTNPYYNNTSNLDNKDDILIQKLNYVISLLEEQKDEKTNNVTEEVILYSFLGIFIIFITDSFVKIGKYVR